MYNRIVNNEYIDFARLLPKDRVTSEDDHWMELISKGGQTFSVPVVDHEVSGITSFSKWEQAFRVFSKIQRFILSSFQASELISYNQVICTASQSFAWENVYHYDKEFRLHIANFPLRSWSVILQQAWMMCLKDRIHSNFNTFNKGGGKHKKEPCKCFNRGQCTAGLSCKYNHRCTVPECGKFGHGVHICRKRNNVQNNSNSGTSSVGVSSQQVTGSMN